MTLQDKIASLRKESNLSQSEVAEQMGVQFQTVSRWENGYRVPELDNLIKIADVFGVSLDIFRQDVSDLHLPHPLGKEMFGKETPRLNEVPLKFGSTQATSEEKAILGFCGAYLDSLPKEFFVQGAGQNSEYGIGRYFWERNLDLLMFIGFVPPLQEENPDFAFSISINTERPLSEEMLAQCKVLQKTDGESENWIYAPIECGFVPNSTTIGKEMPPSIKKTVDTSLKTVMQIARTALETPMFEMFGRGK